MISSLAIKQPDKTHIASVPHVPYLAPPRVVEFAPGLNIIWGPNGCGKSTIIRTIATLLHCYQGGVPMVTEISVRAVQVLGTYPSKIVDDTALVLEHDGQGAMFVDPGIAVGTHGGSFDDDFMEVALGDLLRKSSSGQTTVQRLLRVMVSAKKNGAPPVVWTMTEDKVNDIWAKWLADVRRCLAGTRPPGQPTVLLDEPDKSLDIPQQRTLWAMLERAAQDIQIIAASHSPFATSVRGANYIEMTDGYLAESRLVVASLHRSSADDHQLVSD